MIILVGLFVAGPWLTMAAAVAMARWTSLAATLLASRRIGDDPRAAFRAVSGLVLALFITTVAVVAITTQDAKEPTRFGTVAQSSLMTDQIATASASGSGVSDPGPAAPADALAARLDAIGGIQGVAVLRVDPALTIPASFQGPSPDQSKGIPKRIVTVCLSPPRGPGRRGLVRAARGRSRSRPLPGRGDGGGNPGGRLRP